VVSLHGTTNPYEYASFNLGEANLQDALDFDKVKEMPYLHAVLKGTRLLLHLASLFFSNH